MGPMTRGILVTALLSSLTAPAFAQSYNTQPYQNWQPQAGAMKPETVPLGIYGVCFIHGYTSRCSILNMRYWVSDSKVKKDEMSQIEKEQRELAFASVQGMAKCYLQTGPLSGAFNDQIKKGTIDGFEDGERAADLEAKLPVHRAKQDWRSVHINPAYCMFYLRPALYSYGEKLKLNPLDVQEEITREQKNLESCNLTTSNDKK